LARVSIDLGGDGVMSFSSSPKLVLPATEDAERLRQKWAERRAEAERSRFWWDVQQKKQRIHVEEQPDEFKVPPFISEYPIG
jgi:hypothetical protein